MLALAFIAWVVTGLICLADLLERRAEKRRNVVDLDRERAQRREPSNVVPLVTRNNVRVVPLPRKWGA